MAILDTGLDPQSQDAVGLIDPKSTSFVAEDDKWVKALFPGRALISDLNVHGTNVASQVSSTAFRSRQVAEQSGVTVVVAAGNSAADMDHTTNVHFAYCDQTHVICVSATGPVDETKPVDIDSAAVFTNFSRARATIRTTAKAGSM